VSQSTAVRDAISVLGVAARELDADGLRGPDAAALLEHVVQGERSLAAIKTLLAKRVDETGAFRSSGHRSAADWLAATTGSTFTAAANTLAIGASLDTLPEVAEALRGGELSEAQATIVVDTARRVPDAAGEMVAAAKRPGTLKGLREKATRIKCAAEPDDAAWAARLHKNRYHRRWTGDDGAGCGEYRLAPDAAARLWAALDAKEEQIFQAARRRDPEHRESRLAYAADALVALVDGTPTKPTRLQVIIDGDQATLRGVGPIPKVTAAGLTAASRVHEVRRDGAHLDGIDSTSRHIPADLKRWLDSRYPTCGVEGCDRDQHLEDDHVIPLSEGGTTCRDNLWRLCPWHHDKKTYEKWRVTGTTHAWNLEPPDPPGQDPTVTITEAVLGGGGAGAAARKSRRRASRPGSKTRPSVSEGAGARRSGGARAPHPLPRSGSP